MMFTAALLLELLWLSTISLISTHHSKKNYINNDKPPFDRSSHSKQLHAITGYLFLVLFNFNEYEYISTVPVSVHWLFNSIIKRLILYMHPYNLFYIYSESNY